MHVQLYRRRSTAEEIIIFISAILFFTVSVFGFLVKTNYGKVFIHDITVESYEGFPYEARLYRPVSANSMDPYPAALLSYGKGCDRSCGDYAAAVLTRKGYVVLSIESFNQGKTTGKPEYYTENSIDAGFTYLQTRSFVDHSKIDLAAWTDAAVQTAESKTISDFSSVIFISPLENSLYEPAGNIHIYDVKPCKDKIIAGARTLSFVYDSIQKDSGISDYKENSVLSYFNASLLLFCRILQFILTITILFAGSDLLLHEIRCRSKAQAGSKR